MDLGHRMKNRMGLLGLSVPALAEQTFLPEGVLRGLLENQVSVTDLEDFDRELLKNALHLSDLTEWADSLGHLAVPSDSAKCRSVKIRVCDFLQDFAFLSSVGSDQKGVCMYGD